MQGQNRSFQHTNTRNSPTMHCAFVSGSSGAVPAMSSANMLRSRGIRSITRNSTGNYTVVLERGCNDIVEFTGHVRQASWATTGAGRIEFVSQSLSGTPSFVFQCRRGTDGAVIDPSSGDVVNFTFTPKYSAGSA